MREWVPVEDFPGYEVSYRGQIRNADTLRVLGIYDNGHGVIQVVIRKDKKNHARAVHKLVARAFLDPAPDDCVPVHIDGDWRNNNVDNLVWKERWFAEARTRQAKRFRSKDPRPVRRIKTGEVWPNALEAAKDIGGLENLLILTIQNRHGATYMGSAWAFEPY